MTLKLIVIHGSIEHWPLPQRFVLYLDCNLIAMLSTAIFLTSFPSKFFFTLSPLEKRSYLNGWWEGIWWMQVYTLCRGRTLDMRFMSFLLMAKELSLVVSKEGGLGMSML